MFWILLTIAVASFIYFILFKPFTYWSNRGIVQLEVWASWRRMFKALLQKRPTQEAIRDLYNCFPNHRYAGVYQLFKPILWLRDPDLIKEILVKNFDHFVDHVQVGIPDTEPLWQKNLLSLKGDQWRDMRATVSPSFTSSKMKGMFKLMCECADQTVSHYKTQDTNTLDVEVKDTFVRFANDVIASIAFGVKCDSLKDPDNEFYTMGKTATNFPTFTFVLLVVAPRLAKLLGVRVFNEEVTAFFRNLIKNNIAEREAKGIVRPDMIHLLMEARKGRLKHEEPSNETADSGFAVIEESNVGKAEKRQKQQLTDDDVTAQAVIFFLAGFDTTSSIMTFMAYELALNPDIQERLQREIDETLNSCGGALTYDALIKMKYLDMVISETLRKWPTTTVTDRICAKPYTIQPVKDGEKPLHLKEGDMVGVFIYGLHRDPQLYPDPDKFDPERFSDENKSSIIPYSFLAFGAGPRSCIGNRFALLEIKILFFYMLSKFHFKVIDKTVIPLKIGPSPINLASDGGVWLGLKPRKTDEL